MTGRLVMLIHAMIDKSYLKMEHAVIVLHILEQARIRRNVKAIHVHQLRS